MDLIDLIPSLKINFSIPGLRRIKLHSGEILRGHIVDFIPKPPANIRRLQKQGVFYPFDITKIVLYKLPGKGEKFRDTIEIKLKDIKRISRK
jgi:hypothetical protein